mgnify:CR=1 FL=1
MDLHQGQLCKIKRKSDGEVMGIYAKLRSEDGKQAYYKLRRAGDDPSASAKTDILACADVDVSSGKAEMEARPYVVIGAVPSGMYARFVVLNPEIDAEAEVDRASVYTDIALARAEAEHKAERLERKLERYNETKTELEKYRAELREMNQIEDAVKAGQALTFSYAYGVHTPGGVEYCWRIPSRLEGTILVGMRVVGNTKHGEQEFTVTRVEHSNRLFSHQLVVAAAEEESKVKNE